MPLRFPEVTRTSAIVGTVGLSAIAIVGAGALSLASLDTRVRLDVDGARSSVRSSADTVGALLASQGVKLRSDDTVSPSVTSPLPTNGTVTVKYAKPVTVIVDGKATDDITHAATVKDLFSELDVTPANSAYVSDSLDDHLDRNGEAIVVSSLKKVTVVADGKKQVVRTTAPTVQQVLAKAGVNVGQADEVTPAVDSYLPKSADVTVVRITTATKTVTEPIKFDTTVTKDDTLTTDETKVVTPGQEGEAKTTYQVTYADGKVRAKQVISRDTVRPPVAQVESQGTKDPDDVDGGVWDRLAQCESGGNWHLNTGNGYYGGIQFSLPTWRSVGGTGLPSDASKAEQIKRGKMLQAKAGWGQWTCAARVGLG